MPFVNEGRLVRIRPIEAEDLERLSRWRRDSEALGGFMGPVLKSDARDRAQHAEDQFLTPDYAMFAVEAIEDGRLVAKVGYSKDSPIYEHMARTISVVGDPGERGKGFATEGRILLINYLFLSTNLERVYSETDERNRAARRSLEKCGMRFEGVLRHLVYDLGAWVDMAVCAILREEWARSPLYAPYRDPFCTPWTDTRDPTSI